MKDWPYETKLIKVVKEAQVAMEAISPMADNAQDMRDDDECMGAYGFTRQQIWDALEDPLSEQAVTFEALRRQIFEEEPENMFFWMPDEERFTAVDVGQALNWLCENEEK